MTLPGELPPEIRDLSGRVAAITSARSTPDLAKVVQLMVAMLHVAVYGGSWARPEPPQEVWLGLLAEVRDMRARS